MHALRRERYELCLLKEGAAEGAGNAGAAGVAGSSGEQYQFSRCTRLLPAATTQRLGVPLPPAERTVLHDSLGWEEIQVRPVLELLSSGEG